MSFEYIFHNGTFCRNSSIHFFLLFSFVSHFLFFISAFRWNFGLEPYSSFIRWHRYWRLWNIFCVSRYLLFTYKKLFFLFHPALSIISEHDKLTGCALHFRFVNILPKRQQMLPYMNFDIKSIEFSGIYQKWTKPIQLLFSSFSSFSSFYFDVTKFVSIKYLFLQRANKVNLRIYSIC